MEAVSVLTVRLRRKATGSITSQVVDAFGDLDALQCVDVTVELDANGGVLALRREASGNITDQVIALLDQIAAREVLV